MEKVKRIGIETSSLMPLVVVSPFSNSVYNRIWLENRVNKCEFFTTSDCVDEAIDVMLKYIQYPLKKIEQMRDESQPHEITPLFVQALKHIAETRYNAKWIFFLTDVAAKIDQDCSRTEFCNKLIKAMNEKFDNYRRMLTPEEGILTIDISKILPYWGYHKIDGSFLKEKKSVNILVNETLSQEEYEEQYEIWIDSFTSALKKDLTLNSKRDMYHYHVLHLLNCDEIWVGNENFHEHLCPCPSCKGSSNLVGRDLVRLKKC
ncbi:MAG: hypothetical protein JW878_05415 [Methanomicrobia archaeon]|nr:hypothetical protein [Methanomicrobia archaeon]